MIDCDALEWYGDSAAFWTCAKCCSCLRLCFASCHHMYRYMSEINAYGNTDIELLSGCIEGSFGHCTLRTTSLCHLEQRKVVGYSTRNGDRQREFKREASATSLSKKRLNSSPLGAMFVLITKKGRIRSGCCKLLKGAKHTYGS